MLIGIITCHSITKVDGSMVMFRTIAAIRYTGLTFLYHAESAYAGILTGVLDPFWRPDTPIMQIMGQSI
jgi:hypothetical protein